jgi:uncharacterized membrane protein HdeD (DUF308 family)
MNGRRAHRTSTLVLSLAMVVIGLALIVQAVSAGVSSVSPRLLLGALFVAAGVARGYLEVKRGQRA